MLSPPNRKCKLVTSGPWLEVAPIPLRDVSILPESPGARGGGHGVALWAVSDKGDVLCRLGVSELNPAVSALAPAHPAGPLGLRTDSSSNGTSAATLGWAQASLGWWTRRVACGVPGLCGQWEPRVRLGRQRLGPGGPQCPSSPGPQGSSWLHVGTDQPFTSVSIGGCHQVWAVARDGSAFYRGAVSPSQPAGECHHPAGGPPTAPSRQREARVFPLPGEADWQLS